MENLKLTNEGIDTASERMKPDFSSGEVLRTGTRRIF